MWKKLRVTLAVWITVSAVGCKSGMKPAKPAGGASYDNLISEMNAPNVEKAKDNPFSQISGAKKKNPFQLAWASASSSVTKAFTPKKKKILDATSLSNSPDKVPAEVHLSAGRVMENQGRTAEAIRHYRSAIVSDPKNLSAIVSLARLHDRAGDFTSAVAVYGQAVRAHPKNPLVHNDLGLCYARQGRIEESLNSLGRAVEINPKSAKYRNNIATVLVENDRIEDAYRYLRAAQPEHITRYNMAYLLNRRGQKQQALAQCQLALKSSAGFAPAVQMLKTLGGQMPAQDQAVVIDSGPAEETFVATQATIQGPRAGQTETAPLRAPVQDEEPRRDLRYSDDDTPRLLPPVVDLK